MRGPTRLKNDPNAPEALRDALVDERDLVDDVDLGALRDRLVGGPPPAAVPRPGWVQAAVISGITATVVSLAVLALQPAPTQPLPPVPRVEVVVPQGASDVAPRIEVRDATEREPAIGGASVPSVQVPSAPPSPPPQGTAASPAEPPPPAPVTPLPSETEPAAVPPPSGLKAELALYQAALDASERSEWEQAIDSYTTYLSAYPSGRLRIEAELGLLAASVETRSPTQVEALARSLLEGELGGRRSDVELVLAETLVRLDRCEDALRTIEHHRRESRAVAIRRTCRRSRR